MMMKAKLILLSIAFMVSGMSVSAQDTRIRRVAVLDIMDNEEVFSNGIKLMIRSKLSSAITNTPGYEGYDRVDIASIMNEQEFQRTGLVSDSQIKRLGEMTGADYILTSEVARFDNNHVIITAKILNVESAKLERVSDITTTTDIETLEKCCRTFVEKLLAINLITGATKGELRIDGNVYIGEHKDGKPHGSGTMRFANKDNLGRKSYKGEWRNGVCHGMGTMVYTDGMYKGRFNMGMRQGSGIYYYSDGSRYDGNWQNDKRNGSGRIYYADPDPENRIYFEGYWENEARTGVGKILYRNDDKEIANYQNDKRNGSATYYVLGDGHWEGSYVDDKKEGKWECYDNTGYHTETQIYKNGELIKTKTFGKNKRNR